MYGFVIVIVSVFGSVFVMFTGVFFSCFLLSGLVFTCVGIGVVLVIANVIVLVVV